MFSVFFECFNNNFPFDLFHTQQILNTQTNLFFLVFLTLTKISSVTMSRRICFVESLSIYTYSIYLQGFSIEVGFVWPWSSPGTRDSFRVRHTSDPCVHGLREERERGCAAAAFTNQRDRFLDISRSCPDHLYSFVMSNEFVF